jgi:hypothetical protein
MQTKCRYSLEEQPIGRGDLANSYTFLKTHAILSGIEASLENEKIQTYSTMIPR